MPKISVSLHQSTLDVLDKFNEVHQAPISNKINVIVNQHHQLALAMYDDSQLHFSDFLYVVDLYNGQFFETYDNPTAITVSSELAESVIEYQDVDSIEEFHAALDALESLPHHLIPSRKAFYQRINNLSNAQLMTLPYIANLFWGASKTNEPNYGYKLLTELALRAQAASTPELISQLIVYFSENMTTDMSEVEPKAVQDQHYPVFIDNNNEEFTLVEPFKSGPQSPFFFTRIDELKLIRLSDITNPIRVGKNGLIHTVLSENT